MTSSGYDRVYCCQSNSVPLRNDKQWLRSCYCCHNLGHCRMTSSGYDHVTDVTNSDTAEWQAVATVVLLLSQTRTLMNNNQWLRSCYCCHKLGHCGMSSSGYDRVTDVTNSDTEEWQAVATIVLLLSQTRTLRMASIGYDRVTAVTNSDTEEWQAVATIVLLLSQIWTLRNDKQWLRSCYCCHKLGHWGMTSSGYDRVTFVTGVTNSDIEEWQAAATIVLLLSLVSQSPTLRNDKQWLRSCYCCHRCHQLGHWGMTSSDYGRVTVVTNADSGGMPSSGYDHVTVVTGVTNSDIEEWQAVAMIVLLLSQTRTLRNDK